MKFTQTVLTVCCLIAVTLSMSAAFAEDSKDNPAKARVGTYDSRLVATAYVRSDAFGKRMKSMFAELQKAREAGNDRRVKELEAEGPALQALIHKQGFGTWPVHDILKTIKDEIPKVAKEANVDLIVSKWEVVYQGEAVEPVDVTDLIVAHFDPDEATIKVLKSLREQDPVPLDKLKEH